MARRASFVLVLLAVTAVTACGASAPDATVDDAACASLLPKCLADQKTCVVGAGGPSCEPCPEGQFAAASGACAALVGDVLSHDFPDQTAAPGEEILGKCRSWTLGNDTELWVNAVELVQDEASHHSNWTFVPEGTYDGPDGIWTCADRNYSQLTAALAGGVLYAQSTQATKEVQKFPDGVVVRLPPHVRIISDIHVLNTTSHAVTGHARLNLYAIAADAVTVKLTPFHMTYQGLAIPAHATSRFTGSCDDLAQRFQGAGSAGLEAKLYYLLPHTHALGSRFFLNVIGGPDDGRSLIDVTGFNSEARGKRFDPPVDLMGASGLRFGCEFDNPRNDAVGWGFGDQEMCEALGFFESPVAFESSVTTAAPDGAEGAVQKFTGACSTLAFAWDK